MQSDKVLDDFLRYGSGLFVIDEDCFPLFQWTKGIDFFVFLVKVFEWNNTVVSSWMIFIDQDVFLLIGFIPIIWIKKKDIFILHSGHQDIVLFVQIQTDNCHAAVVQCMIDAALLTYVDASS